MVTKKQHYYPRTLIKHFANEDDKLYLYTRMVICNLIFYFRSLELWISLRRDDDIWGKAQGYYI